SGVSVVLLDEDDTVSLGSRGVCYAKRTLEILDRLGLGDACVAKGVSWNVGRTFFRKDEVYHFNLRPQDDHKRPGMINLQQYYLEEFLIQRARTFANLDLRFKNKLVALSQDAEAVTLQVQTPDGGYSLQTDWLVAADGARSGIRRMMGLEMDGKVFMDRFLIADVVMKADFPHERWFWFDPPFHPGQSVLLHRQADNVYRIDFQLGWQADPEQEKQAHKVIPRIQAMLGDARPFELEWVSVYTFQCRRMKRFNHGRVLFVGDAAHQVSPFGARGANSGIQDSDNLCWKLKLVMDGKAPASLLDSYSGERTHAADENILNSTRSTDFISPKSRMSLTFRNAALSLAREHPFARALVNSGRLSVPAVLAHSTLNTPDADRFAGGMVPGAVMDDAPMTENGQPFWLLDRMGKHFMALLAVADPGQLDAATLNSIQALAEAPVPLQVVLVSPAPCTAPDGLRVFVDAKQRFAERFDAQPGSTWLIRPDQHIAARWRTFNAHALQMALALATGNQSITGNQPDTHQGVFHATQPATQLVGAGQALLPGVHARR
ncbi:MAG: FAD-dependent oxidoreductase, partial [Rhodoferax sp.]|nr:FAD-dependent oxidoreductase [Rhodoferax sp.]